MLQSVPKWKVTVSWQSGESRSVGSYEAVHTSVTFWVFDNAANNVLRTVSHMQFTPTGLEPVAVSVEPCDEPRQFGVALGGITP